MTPREIARRIGESAARVWNAARDLGARALRAPSPPAPTASDNPAPDIFGGMLVVFLFFGVLGTWAATAPLDAAVVAAGEVKVSGNRETIQHRDGGVVANISVSEGDHVEAGDVLVELAADQLTAEEQALASETIELQASRERLIAESAGRRTFAAPAAWRTLEPEYKEFTDAVLARQRRELAADLGATGARVSVLSSRQLETKARISGYNEQIQSIDEELRLVQDELASLQELAKDGFAAENRVRATQRQVAELRERRADLVATIAQSKESVGETQMQQVSTRQDRASQIAEELRATDTRLSDVAPKWRAARQQLEATRIRATVSGRVVGLAFFNPGAVVRPGDRILDIVPDSRRMIMEVKVRPIDADNVVAGQAAMVRFSAFEGRRIPVAKGSVVRISADRFEDPHNGHTYFLAEVEVSESEIETLAEAAGRSLQVMPGLPVEVIVKLRKRTALQYLTEPLLHSFWRSFREH